MERFTLCSRILYDNDILDKNNEIIRLKQILDTPKILFKNNKEWEDSKNKLYTEINLTINKYIVLDVFEYEQMSYFGLTSMQYIKIVDAIETGLTILTNNSKWSEKIACEIIYGIDGFFNGMINSNTWNIMYNILSAQDLANIVYENIHWQLDNEEHSPCILENIPIFKCIMCIKKYNYINDTGLCFNCECESKIPKIDLLIHK